MPEQFENDVKFDGKKSLQDLDTIEMYLHPKNQAVSFQNRKMFCFRHFRVFTRCRFQNVPVKVPFSKSTVFKIYRQKMCRSRVKGRPIRHIFCRFQNVPASCERSLSVLSHKDIEINQSVFGSFLWVSFSSNSICSFLFCYVLVCGILLYHGQS